ncbi:MAG TPA: DNA recombination protein RmuC [Candidatus Saccharimonadales bacterium]|nr:DNA recombination protein RmuC [Candidatus Saccharimonadales bacterium]
MEIAGILAGAVIAAVIVIIFMYLFQQKFTLQLTKTNEEQRKDSKEEIETDVKNIFSEITKNIEKQLEISRKEVGDLKNQNAAIKEQLAMATKATEGLQVSTDGLKNLLTNNRLRGEWGEQVADELLQAAGFVENVNYTKQTKTEEGRPDITINLPDGAKLNVDAKFPFDDLLEYQEAKTPAAKKQALAKFRTSIKNKVKDITSKDYIDPKSNTLDFVVMFIPNEMIFSFIYEKLPEINEYCNKRKVVLAGPFGFTAVLRLVLQAYKNFGYEQNLQEIFGLVSQFQEEYEKFGDHLQKLGNQLATTQKTYNEVEGTRSRQLSKVVDKITSKSQFENKNKKLIED